MIVINEIPKYYYTGYWQIPSFCGLKISKDSYNYIVIITERDDNPGTSITNVIESLCTQIYTEFLQEIPRNKILWLEHYIYKDEKSYDQVKMDWNKKKKCFEKPRWNRIKKPDLDVGPAND